MNFKDYSDATWSQIHQALDQVLMLDPQPVAAFDADGTLWDTDLGESFFQYQIKHHLVPLPKQPWEHYLQLKKKNNDPREAYLWLAQICQGVPLEQVHAWAEAALQANKPLPYFYAQKKLLELLINKGVQVYIITASVKWAVEPGARMLGLSENCVLGVETKIENGLITSEQKGLITYREGKPAALLQKTQQKIPFLASGNTMGDFELLRIASHLRLAVTAAQPNTRLYETEMQLQAEAKKLGWLTQSFLS